MIFSYTIKQFDNSNYWVFLLFFGECVHEEQEGNKIYVTIRQKKDDFWILGNTAIVT